MSLLAFGPNQSVRLVTFYHKTPLSTHYLPNYFQRSPVGTFRLIGNGVNLTALPVAQEVGGSRPLSRPKFEPKPPIFRQLTGVAP
jgi:hypothetical protein